MARVHILKTWTEYFNAVKSGAKQFEGRQDDRNYKVGDTLILREWNPKTEEYTGRELQRIITYKLDGGQFGIQQKWCVLSIATPQSADAAVNIAVLTRLCTITHVLETKTFPTVGDAMVRCIEQFRIPYDAWEAYLIREDKDSKLKYNDTPVSYCGWKCQLEESQVLYIHSFAVSDNSCGATLGGNVTP